MKQSQLLGKTVKETPKDAHTIAHNLMLRSGYIRQLSAGVYSYLPLMLRVLNKISGIVREELDKQGCQELLLPALQPRELWLETDRWDRYTAVDGILFAFKDRRGATVCLGPTHEEVITDIMRHEISSYKDLPKILYQIQTKFRDEIRPRFGLMRAREFIMKDAYSFDIDRNGMDSAYLKMRDAYHNICQRLGFEYRSVEADAGAIGGAGGSEEFMVLAENGEDTILYCNQCDYAANQEKAESILEEFEQDPQQKPMEAVFGEGLIGVEPLSEFLKIPVWKTTKTLLYEADGQLVAVMVRGDCAVNEIKVSNYLACEELRLTSAETIKELTGAEVGYAGPIGLPDNVKIIADNFVDRRVNFECGANQTDYHNINVNFERDLPRPLFADFKLAKAGDKCPRCKNGCLQQARGIEVGHVFKLGTKYSEKLNCNVLDSEGQTHTTWMGCYGIGISRMAAAIIEQNNDENGIIWPAQIAPFQVHLLGLNLEQPAVREEAGNVYSKLQDNGFEVLFDDRELRAGEKFNDADLIGIPLRLTISNRTIKENKIEVKQRAENDKQMLTLEQVLQQLKAIFI